MSDFMHQHLPPEEDVPTLSEEGGVRYLHLGTEWVQGAMSLRRPHDLVLEYTQQLMAWLLFCEPQADQSLGILGLGAGSLLRFALKHTPCQIEVAEWNPAVTETCRRYFKLRDNHRARIDHLDASLWLNERFRENRYLALMVDLYDYRADGPVRDSLEFYQSCYKVLADGTAMTVNLFGDHISYDQNLENINQAFDGHFFELPQTEVGNQVILAWKGPFFDVTIGELLDRARVLETEMRLPASPWVYYLLDKFHPEETVTESESHSEEEA